MKLLITTTLSLLLTVGAFAQKYLTQVKPFDKKEWGYMNEKAEFIIEAKYRKCYKFSDGYAPIYENKKFFFIDSEGKTLQTEVDGFKLANVFGIGMQGFSEGMAPVLIGKKWGYMDTNGKMVIEAKYDKALKFDGGSAIVRKGDDFFVINKEGKEFVVSGAISCKSFSEGLSPYRATNKMFGFIGGDGEVVINAQFVSVGYFVAGLAWAKTMDKKVGFINKTGEWVIKPKFLAVKNFDPVSGLAMVKEVDKWSYTDKTGKIISLNIERTYVFKNGLAKGRKNDKWGFYNKDGDWVIEAQFDGVRDFKNGFAAVKKGDKWGFINKKGEQIIEPIFGGVKDMELIK